MSAASSINTLGGPGPRDVSPDNTHPFPNPVIDVSTISPAFSNWAMTSCTLFFGQPDQSLRFSSVAKT